MFYRRTRIHVITNVCSVCNFYVSAAQAPGRDARWSNSNNPGVNIASVLNHISESCANISTIFLRSSIWCQALVETENLPNPNQRCQSLPWRNQCPYGTDRSVSDASWILYELTFTDYLLLASIQKLLNLNHDTQPIEDNTIDQSGSGGLISHSTPILNEDGDPIWKVLVFDKMGRDVISSVLRVNDLRAWGITIHLYG